MCPFSTHHTMRAKAQRVCTSEIWNLRFHPSEDIYYVSLLRFFPLPKFPHSSFASSALSLCTSWSPTVMSFRLSLNRCCCFFSTCVFHSAFCQNCNHDTLFDCFWIKYWKIFFQSRSQIHLACIMQQRGRIIFSNHICCANIAGWKWKFHSKIKTESRWRWSPKLHMFWFHFGWCGCIEKRKRGLKT